MPVPFIHLDSRVVPLPVRDIDTDQIIPARFLVVTDKEGLAEFLFADWRNDPSFVLHRPEVKGASILVAGDNFGCGSSREHAPWALRSWGFRAVVSTSFADIFRNNALKNGLLPVEVDPTLYKEILAERSKDPTYRLQIDVSEQTLTLPSGKVHRFPIDSFAKFCLLEGTDELAHLLSLKDKITAYEARHVD